MNIDLEEATQAEPSSSSRRRKSGLALATAAVMMLSILPSSDAAAGGYTFNPSGSCSALRVSGFQHYGVAASSVRDNNNDCGQMKSNHRYWYNQRGGSTKYYSTKYCSNTSSNYKRCTGGGEWTYARGYHNNSYVGRVDR